ncbi:MAG: C40 family peptidase [Paludibacter sp.]
MNRITTNGTIHFRHLLLLCAVALIFVDCSTTRRLERQLHREVYGLLELNESGKDNFELYREAASWLKTPHVEGGLTHKGIDCSGLVYMLYKNVYGKTLERSSGNMLRKNCDRIRASRLREGDLVFFSTGAKSRSNVNHVGIYLKENKFIHTSTSRGVMVSSLEEDYFRKTWFCGGRVKHYR